MGVFKIKGLCLSYNTTTIYNVPTYIPKDISHNKKFMHEFRHQIQEIIIRIV